MRVTLAHRVAREGAVVAEDVVAVEDVTEEVAVVITR